MDEEKGAVMTGDIGRFKGGVGAVAEPMADSIFGRWGACVEGANGACIGGVGTVGSMVRARGVGRGRVEGVSTDLECGFDVGPGA